MKKEKILKCAPRSYHWVTVLTLAVTLLAGSSAWAADWVSLFDGTLDAWKANEAEGTFHVKDSLGGKAIVARGTRSHLFYMGDDGRADFKNFEFEAEVKAMAGANSGIYFHTTFQDEGWPGQGFEVQINNSQVEHNGYLEMKKTGSLYGIRNIYRAMAADNTWFTLRILVQAKHVQIWVDDVLLVDHVEPTLSHGTFALQGHDPGSEVHFRNLRVRRLSDGPDAVDRDILALGRANFPLIDFHTHLKDGLTLEEVLEHTRRTGINHGIAVNGGVGFPITDDAGIEAFRKSMEGQPVYIGLQAEGREWPTLFSNEAIAKFDYVFTDSMTILDLRGKRTRLWMSNEVTIRDTQAFMDHLVDTIEKIFATEPIDMYVNSTFLPEVIAADYDTLWTTERMDRVIAAAVKNGIAIEINSRYKIPSARFIKRAKTAGVKFTLGTNNVKRGDLQRLEYALAMVKACNLRWQDMWMPKPDGQKPVQVKQRASAAAVKPYGPIPTERQLRWHDMAYYGFLHFTVNTFTDKEWGYGDESPTLFDPTDFDADQIVRTAKAGGMKGLILTAKHHDGFCLWPSKYTEHSVKNSPWKNGRGDVVRDISEACQRHGLRFGVYLSPWDRNHKDYGRPEYITYYRNQMRELLTGYGDIFTVWFDGANGGDGYYGGARETRRIDNRTYYDWKNTWQIVRELMPMAVMFSDVGPDFRWVGNEHGFAGEPCWATLNPGEGKPGHTKANLNQGERPGSHWMAPECDVSIRPGWFYHASQDKQVKTPEKLLEIYYKSVGRGGCLNLNLPPDRRGQIHDNDVAALKAFREILDATFSHDLAQDAQIRADHVRGQNPAFAADRVIDGDTQTYWATDDSQTTGHLTLTWDKPVMFNVVSLREYLPLGQRIEKFVVDIWQDGAWSELVAGTSIGARRLLRTPFVRASKVRVRITQAAVCPVLSEVSLYAEPIAVTTLPVEIR